MGKNRFNKFNQQQPEGGQQMAQPEEHRTIILGEPVEDEIIAFDGGAMQSEGDEHSAERKAEQAGAELVELLTGLPDLQEVVIEALTGEQQQAEPEEVSPQRPEGETETLPVAPVLVLGIGQFVRQMMLKSTKNNTEILELVHKHFPEAKTTPACIAWYKSDLRKKGLISGSAVRGARSIVEFTPEMLTELCK